jgi:hypothetical protein
VLHRYRGGPHGFPLLHPVASVVICLFILKAAYEIAQDANFKMVDKAYTKKTIEEKRAVILPRRSFCPWISEDPPVRSQKSMLISKSAQREFSLATPTPSPRGAQRHRGQLSPTSSTAWCTKPE